MAKIIDPDQLNQGTEIIFDSASNPRTIQLLVAGNLSNDGVAEQAIYSFCKEEWKTDSTLVKHPFPLVPIDGPSGTQFNLVDWEWKDATTIGLIRDGGWAQKDASGVSEEEWMNITSLGSFISPGSDQAYYTQGDLSSPVDIDLTGPVNQAIKIYGDASHGNIDYRSDFIIFLREQAKKYAQYDLIVEQNISALTYKKYALPLSNENDLKITHSDAEVALAPYTNIGITYYGTAQSRTIGAGSYDFKYIIDGDNKTLEEIYEKVQYQLRQTTDIDDGAGTVRGDTANELLYFVGDTLHTEQSVFVDNILTVDQNRIVFVDDTGVERQYPYAAAGNMTFNAAIQNDPDAIYRMYFTNDDAGDNSGNDFGTDNAILVNDNGGTPISGNVSGATSIGFDYDYDGNVQRGAGSAGTDVPVTLVSIGLTTSQYVKVTGTLTRSKSNNIGFVASDELTYSNP